MLTLFAIMLLAFDPPQAQLDKYGSVPADSPLSWESADETGATYRDAAISKANLLMGRDADATGTTAELVFFTDRDPFGDDSKRRIAWLVTVPGVTVHRAQGDSCVTDLFIAVAIDGGAILAAFTEVAPEWVKPFSGPRDPEEIAGGNWEVSHWHGFKPPASTVPEVLGEIWGRWGQGPLNSGQIVLRPRFVKRMFPATRVDGESVPVNPPANMWIVHVLGTFTITTHPPPTMDGSQIPEDQVPYFAGMLHLVDDATCSYLTGMGTD